MIHAIRYHDEHTYERAIAHRNTTWAYYQAASELLAAARRADVDDIPAYVRNRNEALDAYERAARDLTRERVWYIAERRRREGSCRP